MVVFETLNYSSAGERSFLLEERLLLSARQKRAIETVLSIALPREREKREKRAHIHTRAAFCGAFRINRENLLV